MKGLFVGVTRSDFMVLVGAIKELYCVNDQYNFGKVYVERENSIKAIRKAGKPWPRSGLIEEEVVKEEKRVPGFKDLIDRLEGELKIKRTVHVPSFSCGVNTEKLEQM